MERSGLALVHKPIEGVKLLASRRTDSLVHRRIDQLIKHKTMSI